MVHILHLDQQLNSGPRRRVERSRIEIKRPVAEVSVDPIQVASLPENQHLFLLSTRQRRVTLRPALPSRLLR